MLLEVRTLVNLGRWRMENPEDIWSTGHFLVIDLDAGHTSVLTVQ